MKDGIKVAMCQIDIASLDLQANRKAVENSFHQACDVPDQDRPDIVVFPELSNTGYVFQRGREFGHDFLKAAEVIPTGATSMLVRKLCKQYRTYCVIGLCESHSEIPGLAYNTAAFFGPNGELIGVQRKLHIPGEEKHYFREGDAVSVFSTELGKIGLQICYDTWYPEVSRLQSYKGCEIMINIWNAPDYVTPPKVLYTMIGSRAIENRFYSIGVNRCGYHGDAYFAGNSMAVDPNGTVLNELCEGPAVVRVVLPEAPLYAERAFQPTLRDARFDVLEETFAYAKKLMLLKPDIFHIQP